MLYHVWHNYFTALPHLHSLEIEVESVHETDLDHLHLHQHNHLSIQVNGGHYILQKLHEAYVAVLHLYYIFWPNSYCKHCSNQLHFNC